MKIIVTQTFTILHKKFRGKKIPSWDSIFPKIINDINKTVRYLNRPYIKIKYKIHDKSLRLFAKRESDILVLLPIFITDKNDTLYGENMTRETIQKKISPIIDDIMIDIKNKKYETFTC